MRSRPESRSRARDCEWLGPRYPLPGKLQEKFEPSRPEVVLWLELPNSVLVSLSVIGPETPLRFEETLAKAMRDPVEGPARTPRRLRVPEQALADALEGTIGDDTPVVVAPRPELDTGFTQAIAATTTPHTAAQYLATDNPPPRSA